MFNMTVFSSYKDCIPAACIFLGGFEIKIRAEVDPHTHTQRNFQRVKVNYADRGFVQ